MWVIHLELSQHIVRAVEMLTLLLAHLEEGTGQGWRRRVWPGPKGQPVFLRYLLSICSLQGMLLKQPLFRSAYLPSGLLVVALWGGTE